MYDIPPHDDVILICAFSFSHPASLIHVGMHTRLMQPSSTEPAGATFSYSKMILDDATVICNVHAQDHTQRPTDTTTKTTCGSSGRSAAGIYQR